MVITSQCETPTFLFTLHSLFKASLSLSLFVVWLLYDTWIFFSKCDARYFPLILSYCFLQGPSHALLCQLQQWPRSSIKPTTPLSHHGQRKCSSVSLTATMTTKTWPLLPMDLIGGGCESFTSRSCFPPSVLCPTINKGHMRCTT